MKLNEEKSCPKEPQGNSVLCCGTHNKENGIAVCIGSICRIRKNPNLQDERADFSKITIIFKKYIMKLQ